MSLVVYADFNCPNSWLASAWADRIVEQGRAEVQCWAVEHDPAIPTPIPRLNDEAATLFNREVAEVRGLSRPGEPCEIRVPAVRANTAAAIAEFASARPPDADGFRRLLFAAYWVEGADIADPTVLAALGAGRVGNHASISSDQRFRPGSQPAMLRR